MFWRALQYRRVWDDAYGSCDADTQETAGRRLDFLQEYGNQSRPPISKHLDDGIFELRAKDVGFLFYFADLQTIVFVHAIVKKRRDVPRTDIQLAKSRREEIKARRVNLSDLSN